MSERDDLIPTIPRPTQIDRPLEPSIAKVSPPYTPSAYRMEAEESVHLLDYWRSIRKRLWLVIGIAVLITSLTAIYMSRKPDVYEARASVQVDLERVNRALSSEKNAVVLNDQVNDPAYFNTQLQILTSASLIRKVVKQLDLEHNPAFAPPASAQAAGVFRSLLRTVGLVDRERPKSAKELPVATSTGGVSAEDMEDAKRLSPYVDIIQRNLSVEPVREARMTSKDTRWIAISFRSSDPSTATVVVNALAQMFTDQNQAIRSEASESTNGYMKKRIAELQADLQKAENELSDYAGKNNIISLKAESDNIVIQRLAGLNSQLLEAENARKLAESQYKAVLSPGAAAALTMDTTARRQIDDINADINKHEQKLAELRVENTDAWPQNQEELRQIEVLKRRQDEIVKDSGSITLTNLYTSYVQKKALEEKLRADFNLQQSKAVTQNQAAIQYRMIEQRIETNRQLLDELFRRQKENDVVAAGSQNNIHVVENAVEPEKPIGPNRLVSVLMSLLMSTALGCGLALFLEYLDDTVRSAEDVENLLRLPALAVIPAIEGAPRRRMLAAGAKLNPGEDPARSELLIKSDSRSSLAESYRQLRTSVLLSTAGQAPKSLLVTSSVPSEGKTTTAVNTAISLAQTGARVLVIDADMRRPRLHNIFNVGNQAGLSTILSSGLSESEILKIASNDRETNLHLLTSGPIPPNPAELIGSEQMRRLLGVLERNFTHIVIDSPPIASFTDGVLLASMVSGVLLVVHAGKSSRGVVKRSRQLLLDVGAKIFGVVLNNVNLRSQEDYYYYQSYYHQSYYRGGADSDRDAAAS